MLMKSIIHIGFDDTDSIRMGCTTYIAALLIEKLSQIKAIFLDYPNLIRLNPNVPWKTRGNGAICLRLIIEKNIWENLVEAVVEVVEEQADLSFPSTDPSIVFYKGKNIPHLLKEFAKKTIKNVVSKKEALKLIKQFQCEAFWFKKGRGLIGALAAIGDTLDNDFTYELIAYRQERNRGTPRKVEKNSVFKMDNKTCGLTFNNIDYEKNRILITPGGPDPVLLGIRGETPDAVKKSFGMLKICEDVERWVIFRTNQGTDAHFNKIKTISQVHPYISVIVQGSIAQEPRTIPGRHVFFTISDKRKQIYCAAYEPTGQFRNIIRKLIRGDKVEVYGGVRPSTTKNPKTINLEKIRLIKLVSKKILKNPVCWFCGKSLKSMGKEKGFRCKKCGFRDRKLKKLALTVERNISENIYIAPPRANRHLTKPLTRYCLDKNLQHNPFLPSNFWGIGNI